MNRASYEGLVAQAIDEAARSIIRDGRPPSVAATLGTVQLYWSGKYGPPIGNAIGIDALENLGEILCDLFSMHEEEQANVQGPA